MARSRPETWSAGTGISCRGPARARTSRAHMIQARRDRAARCAPRRRSRGEQPPRDALRHAPAPHRLRVAGGRNRAEKRQRQERAAQADRRGQASRASSARSAADVRRARPAGRDRGSSARNRSRAAPREAGAEAPGAGVLGRPQRRVCAASAGTSTGAASVAQRRAPRQTASEEPEAERRPAAPRPARPAPRRGRRMSWRPGQQRLFGQRALGHVTAPGPAGRPPAERGRSVRGRIGVDGQRECRAQDSRSVATALCPSICTRVRVPSGRRTG